MSPTEGHTDANSVWGEDSAGWEREPDYMLADLAEDIGDQINALMNQEGVTRAQLAERIGHSAAYVTQLLGGGSNFQLRTLIKLALALDAHVHVNFDREQGLAEAAAERYRRWAAQAPDGSTHGEAATESFSFTVTVVHGEAEPSSAMDEALQGQGNWGELLVAPNSTSSYNDTTRMEL
jgi:transcriptional regulator with XRE-family HTH domain